MTSGSSFELCRRKWNNPDKVLLWLNRLSQCSRGDGRTLTRDWDGRDPRPGPTHIWLGQGEWEQTAVTAVELCKCQVQEQNPIYPPKLRHVTLINLLHEFLIFFFTRNSYPNKLSTLFLGWFRELQTLRLFRSRSREHPSWCGPRDEWGIPVSFTRWRNSLLHSWHLAALIGILLYTSFWSAVYIMALALCLALSLSLSPSLSVSLCLSLCICLFVCLSRGGSRNFGWGRRGGDIICNTYSIIYLQHLFSKVHYQLGSPGGGG